MSDDLKLTPLARAKQAEKRVRELEVGYDRLKVDLERLQRERDGFLASALDKDTLYQNCRDRMYAAEAELARLTPTEEEKNIAKVALMSLRAGLRGEPIPNTCEVAVALLRKFVLKGEA